MVATRVQQLVRLLLGMTVVTGLVDAVSYLALGRVFVANMTGNVVFLGFAWAGDVSLSAWASLAALLAFLIGALAGGELATRRGGHRGHHLAAGAWNTLALLSHRPYAGSSRYALVVLLALAMGLQNATARALGVPDATTTVLTLTLTGLAADSRLAKGANPRVLRRVTSVLAMFAGALVGGLLVLHADPAWALAVAVILMCVIACAATALARGTVPAGWTASP